ncbi:MAG: amino acid ABC transporter permease [Treponema sp.]|nr:amino acid ABC transporter permease [Treponema sp.]
MWSKISGFFEALKNGIAGTEFFRILFAKQRWILILKGLGTTLLIAFCAVVIGSILGCIFALFKISKKKPLVVIANAYTTIIRGIPMATLLMIFYFVIFAPIGLQNTIIVAIIAFGINSGAYCTEIFRAGIQGIDIGQTEAGRSLGLSWGQTLSKIILPQAVRTILPTFTSEFITMIKETSVASFIAVVDLQKAFDNIRNQTYNAWLPLISCAVIYLCLTLGLTKLFSLLEKRMARSERH